jgi:hypothetical protein
VKRRTLLLTCNAVLLLTQPAAASGRAETPEAPIDPLQAAEPALVVTPAADVTVGYGAWYATEIGGGLQYRGYGGFVLELAALASTAVAHGPSGCEAARFCYHDRQRFGAAFEQHLAPTTTFDPYFGLDIELVRAALADGRAVRWGMGIVPKVGVDVSGHWSRALAGVGIFAAMPVGGVYEQSGVGVMVGVRAPLGVL